MSRQHQINTVEQGAVNDSNFNSSSLGFAVMALFWLVEQQKMHWSEDAGLTTNTQACCYVYLQNHR